MYVLVTDTSADVREADDCTALEVRIKATNAEALTTAGLGDWHGEGEGEVDLNVARLHALAAAAATASDWEQTWTAMLAYAERKGWLAPDGSTVRAHIALEPA